MNFSQCTVARISKMLLAIGFVFFSQSLLDHRELMAQQILIRMGGGNKAKLELHNQLKSILDSKRAAAQNRIDSQLNDIELACELSPKQRKRLEIAGKGAVKSFSGKVLEKLQKNANKFRLKFDPDNPPEEEEGEEGAIFGGGNMQIVNLGDGPNGAMKETVESESVWVSSVEKALTETQKEKLVAWVETREKRIRAAAVDHMIGKADLKLFLAPEQREKLRAFVDKEYGSQLMRKMKIPPQANRGFVVLGQQPQRANVEISDTLKELLSEPQQKIWKTNFQEKLDALEEDEGRNLFNFFVR